MGGGRILIVDDDEGIRDLVEEVLEQDGFETLKAGDADEAIETISRAMPDLVLLDVKLDGKDGFEVLWWIRQRSNVPVIMLSGKAKEEMDKVEGLELGADDYMTKPFGNKELKARVRAVLRRANERPQQKPSFNDGWLNIDYVSQRVTLEGKEVKLTRTESDVLQLLASNAGRAVSYDEILEAVWGPGYKGERKHVHDIINSLRKKIDPSGRKRYIASLPSFGYRFDTD